jgi:hypothetical protein
MPIDGGARPITLLVEFGADAKVVEVSPVAEGAVVPAAGCLR